MLALSMTARRASKRLNAWRPVGAEYTVQTNALPPAAIAIVAVVV